MLKEMREMMFGLKSKLCVRDAYAMCKGMRKMMCGYKFKALRKGCISHA